MEKFITVVFALSVLLVSFVGFALAMAEAPAIIADGCGWGLALLVGGSVILFWFVVSVLIDKDSAYSYNF